MSTRKLTVRATKWKGGKKPKTIKGAPLNPNAAAQQRYYSQLQRLILIMHDTTVRRIKKFFDEPHTEEYFAADATVGSQARILMNALAKKFDDIFGFRAKGIADDVVADGSKSSATQLKASLEELTDGLTLKTDILSGALKDIVTASIAENVDLIKSIPEQYHKNVAGAVYRSITTGNGLKDLIPYLDRYKGVTLRRARFIAEDQTRKVFNTINKGRMEQVGIDEYEWLHTGGSQHPRPLHVDMSGNVYRFDKPPIIDKRTGERGIPGQLPNCRCRMVPVVKFKED